MRVVILSFLLLFTLGAEAAVSNAHTVNIRTEPLGDLLGIPNLDLDFDLGHAWTLGGGVATSSANVWWATYTATIWDVNITHYFADQSFASAWYLGAEIDFISGADNYFGLSDSSSATEIGVRGGYQWMWEHFNIQVGAILAAGNSYGSLGIDGTIGFAF